MSINPMQLIQLIKSGMNPQQLVMSILQQNKNVPMFQNVMSLAQNNDVAGLQQIARNLAKERGVNYEESFAQFKSSLK